MTQLSRRLGSPVGMSVGQSGSGAGLVSLYTLFVLLHFRLFQRGQYRREFNDVTLCLRRSKVACRVSVLSSDGSAF